ncbi:MAG: hypothetical protein KIH01_01010 [Candidatus Freyarchaeota archaeon]|nr:hypothetical protein [Candidatus Jordarchaeia archaeon]
MRFVVVVLEPPSSDRTRKIVSLLEELVELGADVSVYFLGDGVYWVVKGCLDRVADGGLKFFAGEGDLEARGIMGELLSEKVKILPDVIDKLVEEVMEEAEMVLSV